jgi:hypothetical protein
MKKLFVFVLLGLVGCIPSSPLSPSKSKSIATDPVPPGLSDNPSSYFENITSLTSAPTAFVLRITSVKKDQPAERAGLRPGDCIIGLDGVRVRDSREYNLIRFFYDPRPTVELTLVRTGGITNIVISDPRPIRSCGFTFSDQKPDFLATLKASNLQINDLLPEPLPQVKAGPPSNGLDLFFETFKNAGRPAPNSGDSGLEPDSEMVVALSSFPARGQEEILALLSTNSSADRNWVAHLIKVYGLLLFERRDEALRILTETRLLEHSSTPFLTQLLQFYQDVASHPPTANEGIPLNEYQVDIPFIALCFPYPLTPNAHSVEFPADPHFQGLFDTTFTGSQTRRNFQAELMSAARPYTIKNDTDPVASYIGVVKAAILDFLCQGGWPYRSEQVWTVKQSAEMVVGLKRRLADHPQERSEIGLSLIAPSIIASDEATFREACIMVQEAGPKVSALANWIMGGTLAMRGNVSPGHWRDIAVSTANNLPTPAIYTYLQKTSPGFVRRYSAGRWVVTGPYQGDVSGPSSFCFTLPFVVAKALKSPLDASPYNHLDEFPMSTMAPLEAEKFAAQLTDVLAVNPDSRYLDALFKMYPTLGAGKAFDIIRQAAFYHEQLWQHNYLNDALDMKAVYRDFFGDVEEKYTRETTAALAKLDNQDPDLPRKIEELYVKAGVPSVCLLLSKKLKEADRTELSARYLQKAIDFWNPLLNNFPFNQEVNAWACRDLASTPGFEDMFDDYAALRSGGGGLVTPILHVYRAIVESYRGRYNSTVEHLIQSVNPALQGAKVVSLYNGTTYASFSELRLQLLRTLVKEGRLSAEQISRLRSVKELNVGGILNGTWQSAVAVETNETLGTQMAQPALDDSTWPEMEVAIPWEKTTLPAFDGLVWFRKTVEIPAAWAGKDLILHLGPVDEVDVTWFNAVRIGGMGSCQDGVTKYWDVPRVYPVPGSAVTAGRAVLTVRVIDTVFAGGIWGADPKAMILVPADGSDPQGISVSGKWKYLVGQKF